MICTYVQITQLCHYANNNNKRTDFWLYKYIIIEAN